MSIDRLANDIMTNLEKSEKGCIEVPVKLLFQILFAQRPASINDLHKQLLDMKMKFKQIDYVFVLSNPNPIVRFYESTLNKKAEKILITMEDCDGRTTNSGNTG